MTGFSGRRRAAFAFVTILTFFVFLSACAFVPNVMAINVFGGSPVTLAMVVGAVLMVASVAITAQFVSGERKAVGAERS